MAILLDSATAEDAKAASNLGWVKGVTTNPKLMAGADPTSRIPELLAAIPDVPIFCQLVQIDDFNAAEEEALSYHEIDPERLVVKIPTRPSMLTLASRLVGERIPCAMTTIFSPAQAALAAEIGVGWVIPYVDRTTRLGGDGLGLVEAMREIIEIADSPTRVMAGSIKSPAGAAEALAAGAHDITASLEVVIGMGQHQWSEESIADFAKAGS